MHFQIERESAPLLSFSGGQGYTWRLVATTGTLCRAPETYGSIALARGAIAQFKRSASGIRFAKVVDPVG